MTRASSLALLLLLTALPHPSSPAAEATKLGPDGKRVKWKWEQMDNGPFFSSNIQGKNPVLKAVTVKLGGGEEAAVAFDTQLLRLAAGWRGGFLALPRGRDGLEGLPQPEGNIVFSSPVAPGWAKAGSFQDPRPGGFGPLPRDWAKWRGLYRYGDNVVLSYTVGRDGVLELPGLSKPDGLTVFTETFELASVSEPLTRLICAEPTAKLVSQAPNLVVQEDAAGQLLAVGLRSGAGPSLHSTGQGRVELQLPKSKRGTAFQVAVWRGAKADLPKFQSFLAGKSGFPELKSMCKGGPPRWNADIATHGVLGKDEAAYVVDTIPLPEDNPWKSWIRCSGLDFFKDGSRAAICSVSGDVWIVSGIDAKLDKVVWKRFATGLFQPLGLKIVKDTIYVLGRDQITRLSDLNKDGEADFYENFNNDVTITSEYHEFCLDLQTDSEGNFYFAKGGNLGQAVLPHHGCLLKVSKDGSKLEIVATGLRAPNGMGVGPHNEITVSDNEGNWVPACRLNLVKPGGFYGHVSTAHRQPEPTDYDKPLCWLPKGIDNSSGGQVWVTSDKWGPFKGDMLFMSYGMSSLFKVMYEEVDGQVQGGVFKFPLKFDSGVMRARFNPKDGQLYTCGLVVWQSNGARQGAFHRVRYTGKSVSMPKDLHVTPTGVKISFTTPLDRVSALDDQNYAVERWNYRWTKEYGSPEYSVLDPNKKGHDPVAIKSIKLSDDRKTVTLELADIKTVMQMRVKFDLKAADGSAITQQIDHTVNRIPTK